MPPTPPQQPTDANEPCQRMAWDSDYFGVEVARVVGDTLTPDRVPLIDDWCRRQRVAWLNFLARSDDAQTTRCAESAGFHQTDLRVTFETRSLAGQGRATPHVDVGPVRETEIDALADIARTSYRDSRFYYDPRVPRDRADELFAIWTAKDCRGAAATVLVARQPGRPIGYATCPIDPATGWGSIGLLGVAEDARGRGVGAALVDSALAWAAERQLPGLTVVTQGRNVTAQRLYQRAGFVTRSLQLYYHKWYV